MAGPSRQTALRTALVLAAVLAGYHDSLGTLVRSFSSGTPFAYLGWVPCLALLSAIGVSRTRDDGPNIHDRYVDYIVGLPMLGTALAMVLLMPGRLSIFFWFWGLDLLSLPLFVAGSVSIVFGVRELWRFRGPIALLLLAWPLPVLSASHALHPVVGLITVGAASLAMLRSPALFGISGGRAWVSGLVSARRRPERRRGPISIPPVRRAAVALTMVLGAASLAAVANQALPQTQVLLADDREPRISQLDLTGTVDGWSVIGKDESHRPGQDFGAGAAWTQYTLVPPRPRSMQLTVEVVSGPDAGGLSRPDPSIFNGFPGYRLRDARKVDLGAGLIGQAFVFVNPGQHTSWLAVSWVWPVRASSGDQYQRVVVHLADVDGRLASVAASEVSLNDSLALVAGLRDGGVPSPTVGDTAATRSFLIAFARSLVASAARQSAAGER